LLGDVHGGDGVLANGLLVASLSSGVALAHDLAHAQLRQLFGQGVFLVEQPRSSAVLSCRKLVTTSFKSSLQMRVASGVSGWPGR
jgi:hypothetical protein